MIVVVLAVFLIGTLIGTILLGVGLLRARVVPVWAAVALIAAPVVSFLAHAVADIKAVDLVGTGLMLVGFGAVGSAVRSVSDQEWERGEIPPRATVGAEVATA